MPPRIQRPVGLRGGSDVAAPAVSQVPGASTSGSFVAFLHRPSRYFFSSLLGAVFTLPVRSSFRLCRTLSCLWSFPAMAAAAPHNGLYSRVPAVNFVWPLVYSGKRPQITSRSFGIFKRPTGRGPTDCGTSRPRLFSSGAACGPLSESFLSAGLEGQCPREMETLSGGQERKRLALAALLRWVSGFGARQKYLELDQLRGFAQSALRNDEDVLRVLVISESDARRRKLLKGLLGYERSEHMRKPPAGEEQGSLDHSPSSHLTEAETSNVVPWTEPGDELGDQPIRRIRYGSRVMAMSDDESVCIQWPSPWLMSGAGLEVIDLALRQLAHACLGDRLLGTVGVVVLAVDASGPTTWERSMAALFARYSGLVIAVDGNQSPQLLADWVEELKEQRSAIIPKLIGNSDDSFMCIPMFALGDGSSPLLDVQRHIAACSRLLLSEDVFLAAATSNAVTRLRLFRSGPMAELARKLDFARARMMKFEASYAGLQAEELSSTQTVELPWVVFPIARARENLERWFNGVSMVSLGLLSWRRAVWEKVVAIFDGDCLSCFGNDPWSETHWRAQVLFDSTYATAANHRQSARTALIPVLEAALEVQRLAGVTDWAPFPLSEAENAATAEVRAMVVRKMQALFETQDESGIATTVEKEARRITFRAFRAQFSVLSLAIGLTYLDFPLLFHMPACAFGSFLGICWTRYQWNSVRRATLEELVTLETSIIRDTLAIYESEHVRESVIPVRRAVAVAKAALSECEGWLRDRNRELDSLERALEESI